MFEECLQLVADVDGALRSMEHWVATARDGASGASGPTEALHYRHNMPYVYPMFIHFYMVI